MVCNASSHCRCGDNSALNIAGTLLIVAVMLLVNADVIGRGAFDAPVSGVPEMVSMSIVAIVFLQIAQTFRTGRLTRTELLLGGLQKPQSARPPRARIAFFASLPLAIGLADHRRLLATVPQGMGKKHV